MANAQSNLPVRNIGGEVRAVFASRCAGCHGPDLAKPKGRFGYILDLRQVAANHEMVIPGQPTESELWLLVQQDKMPPTDSPRGALTLEEKEVIRAWIAAGAPNASALSVDSHPSVQSEPMAPVRSRPVRLLLIAGVLLTALAAHFGGLLDHGADFFSSY